MDNQEPVTREEFADWKGNKVTKVIFESLEAIRDQQTEFLVGGGTLPTDSPPTAQVVGLIKGINLFLEVEVDIEEDTVKYGH